MPAWVGLFLLFVVVPTVELALLLSLGSVLGPLQTFLLVVLTGVVGASFARREGLSVLRQLADDAARGVPPAARLAEAALVVAGGLLLITPGVLTDAAGLSLLFPWTRRLLAPALVRGLANRSASGQAFAFVFRGPGAPSGPHAPLRSSPRPREDEGPTNPFDHPVAR